MERLWFLNLLSAHSFGRYEVYYPVFGSRRPRDASILSCPYLSVDVILQSAVSIFRCPDTSGFYAVTSCGGVSRGRPALTADQEGLTIVQTAGKIKLILQCA